MFSASLANRINLSNERLLHLRDRRRDAAIFIATNPKYRLLYPPGQRDQTRCTISLRGA